MQNAERFGAKFATSIVTTLNCVDRLIFKGYLPLGGDKQLNQFVDRLGICRKDFLPQLEPFSERLVEHAQSAAAEAGAVVPSVITCAWPSFMSETASVYET